YVLSLLFSPLLPSTLFPYPTLFRSSAASQVGGLSPLVHVQLILPFLTCTTVLVAYLLGVKATGRHSEQERDEDGGAREERQDQRSEEHTSELQSRGHLVCRLLLEKK